MSFVTNAPADAHTMTPLERRASASLASLFALRVLGLFLVLPVFALEASRYPGGADAAQVGLAFGIYGLAQACLQIPFGLAADRWGRKPVIVFGLLLFALGSLWAAVATDLETLLMARALQGSGAISAAVTALLADLTRNTVRTKGIALVGVSISVMFVLSLVVAPGLNAVIGLPGLFALTAGLAGLGVVAVLWWVPRAPPLKQRVDPLNGLRAVLQNPQLLRLNFGVFSLHAIQLAMWMVIPDLLVRAGLIKVAHWQVYLPAVVGSLVVLGGVLFRLERRGYLRGALLTAVVCLLLAQVGFYAYLHTGATATWGYLSGLAIIGFLLFLFFIGFNAMEASQPSLVSKFVVPEHRGAALGVFNTAQSLGFFVGGAAGGWLLQNTSAPVVFATCAGWLLVWALFIRGLKPQQAIY
ncbi:MAG: MFS transporter [Burkholderiaceae bacterium]|jgi:MFS family permease|nr:MFS transporter [Burkholderiaceae bacterium]MDP4862396.1 MFS transporter [Burkholderiaceae bacterium]